MNIVFYYQPKNGQCLSVARYDNGDIPPGNWFPMVFKHDADSALSRSPAEPQQALTDAAIERAWRAGWRQCRDAEFVGAGAEDSEWGFAAPNVIKQCATPPQPRQEPAREVESGAFEAVKQQALTVLPHFNIIYPIIRFALVNRSEPLVHQIDRLVEALPEGDQRRKLWHLLDQATKGDIHRPVTHLVPGCYEAQDRQAAIAESVKSKPGITAYQEENLFCVTFRSHSLEEAKAARAALTDRSARPGAQGDCTSPRCDSPQECATRGCADRAITAAEAAPVAVPAGFILEWGAVSLPEGHPSRVTCKRFFETEAEASVSGAESDFDSLIYPVYAAPQAAAVAPDVQRDAVTKLAAFGAACLHAHRGTQACEVGDIDGGTAQELALKHGVIVARTVTEPCGESCVCGEVTDFPTECYFVPDDVSEAIDAARPPTGGREDSNA